MKLTVTLPTGNAGFCLPESTEVDTDAVADVVIYIGNKISEGFTSGQALDPNGNSGGWWSLDESE